VNVSLAEGTNGSSRRRGLAAAGVDRKQLPRNLDAEAAILGGLILDSSTLDEMTELEPDDFYDPRHRIVFSAMRTLRELERPIDVVTLEVEIERQGRLDSIGGIAFIGELVLRMPIASNVLAYRDTVRTLARNRRMILTLASATERAMGWPHDPDELLAETVGELQRIEVDHSIAARARKTRWCLPLVDYLGDSEPDEDDSEDWIIRDLIPRGEPALWGGPMKGGKTWGALDLCVSVAMGMPWLGKFDNTMGKPARVLGLFLEDSKRRLRKRLWELARARNTTPNHHDIAENLRISRATLRLPDAADQRRFAAEIKAWGAVLVVIDNLTRVMIGDPNSTREASAFTKAWTELGDETGATIVFLHHTKKPMGEAKLDPFESLRGSGDFGATARNIIVTTPIRNESNQKLSEVRMRGNLDLRRESFTLGFERVELLGKWRAKLEDRGEVDDVKSEVRKDLKTAKETRKREEFAAEIERRRSLALEIARANKGYVSGAQLAAACGHSSSRTVAPVLTGLVQSGVLVGAGTRGYMLADADRQEGLL
jgi:replicative DNA helicase/biotin operon repressor